MSGDNIDWNSPGLPSFFELALAQRRPIFEVRRPAETPPPLAPREESLSAQTVEKKRHGNSLKKICMKILRLYHKKNELEIFLNEFSINLNIERRRIYDIINILEALDIVVKKSKNVYIWKNINLFVTKLRILGAAGSGLADQLKLFYFETRPMTSKKKMLTYLALKVLKLFYTAKPVLSFAEIMKICEQHYFQVEAEVGVPLADEFENKNRIRRLYDIINVFKALGLISKISTKSEKKIYVWQGEGGFLAQIARLCPTENEIRLPSPAERERAEEGLLGKRVENSAFRLCQKFQDQELFSLKSVLAMPSPDNKPRSL